MTNNIAATEIITDLFEINYTANETNEPNSIEENNTFIIPYSQPDNQQTASEKPIVKAFGIAIHPKEIQSLIIESKTKDRWLNDNIINFYLNLLLYSKKDKTMLTLPSQSFQKYLKNNESENIKLVKENIYDYDLIIIPVCYKNHWSLALLKTKELRVRYFDSLGKDVQAKERNNLLQKFITKIITTDAHHKQIQLNMRSWIFRAESNVPQQTNSYDCGLFTCSFARAIINGEWSSKETYPEEKLETIRKRISEEITKFEIQTGDNSS